jgi:hypothetical protein
MQLTWRIVETWKRGDNGKGWVTRAPWQPPNTKNTLISSIAKQTNSKQQVVLRTYCCIKTNVFFFKKRKMKEEKEETQTKEGDQKKKKKVAKIKFKFFFQTHPEFQWGLSWLHLDENSR